jgi:hypothetical protein
MTSRANPIRMAGDKPVFGSRPGKQSATPGTRPAAPAASARPGKQSAPAPAKKPTPAATNRRRGDDRVDARGKTPIGVKPTKTAKPAAAPKTKSERQAFVEETRKKNAERMAAREKAERAKRLQQMKANREKAKATKTTKTRSVK